MAQWKEIAGLDDWLEVFDASANKPVLVFKHSTTCPISANAWKEFQSYLNGSPNDDTEFVMVKVIESRNVSNQIAHDLHVTHKSPQLILIRNKEAVFNTSHWSITQDNIRKVLQ
ncbi:bacillithiol system redox-active protein YtxJ [Alicyclobacillus fastidiosus]|uniref:Bacillithiol system redox-active protein YtxJ n=1 Tax=Alicyclobacillus fastidiosus TaxID=392011 RepID=A0ABY6ZK16_9BACL|nr:bacillithiol system redox-active protein YtxJ [Alicyclobacillus fastidiosus]WAH42419.1 bacillithiol system redox-active protein YtxJ [Alicyclobacillus fastidiosus]GMA64239.1 hypothetical protein GCM10025859_46790 [Alicyclobacillus fastidiosus]